MLWMIDNYDSFTYNLVQYLQTLGAEVKVVRNDAMSVDEIAAQKPERIVISPGPCTPNEAGVSLELIQRLGPTTPILGVCLGHQGIGQVYGGTVIRAGNIMHGKTSPIRHQGKGVFAGLPDRYQATRYHSLVVDKNSLPDVLEVTAWTENDDGSIEEIMGLRHRQFPVEGVQFHPESSSPNTAMPCCAISCSVRRPDPRSIPMSFSPQEALQRTIEHREIFFDEMVDLMRQIMRGDVSPMMTAAILTGLRVKKETIDEIAAAATVMREFALAVPVADTTHLVDIVGTGGDGSHTFNISTCAMFVAAAAGARVAKHGNRSVSSKSGSADAVEALGAAIELQPAQVAAAIEQTGIGFMFAPIHHPSMKVVAPVRREMGVRTIFNILGPLTNPASAPSVLMGVFHPDLVGIQARVLRELGTERAMVVWGRDNMDEISLGAGTLVGELRDGKVREYEIHPEDFGIAMSASRNLRVDGPEQSIAMLRAVLDNQPGPALDIVALNAGAALYVAGVASDIGDGLARARAAIANGSARQRLQQYVETTRALVA